MAGGLLGRGPVLLQRSRAAWQLRATFRGFQGETLPSSAAASSDGHDPQAFQPEAPPSSTASDVPAVRPLSRPLGFQQEAPLPSAAPDEPAQSPLSEGLGFQHEAQPSSSATAGEHGPSGLSRAVRDPRPALSWSLADPREPRFRARAATHGFRREPAPPSPGVTAMEVLSFEADEEECLQFSRDVRLLCGGAESEAPQWGRLVQIIEVMKIKNMPVPPEMYVNLLYAQKRQTNWQHRTFSHIRQEEALTIDMMPPIISSAGQCAEVRLLDEYYEAFRGLVPHVLKESSGSSRLLRMFNNIVEQYAINAELERAMAVVTDMKLASVPPTSDTYISLIHAAKEDDQLQERIYVHMKNTVGLPQHDYRTVIDYLDNSASSSLFARVLADYKELDAPRSPWLYSCLISRAFKANDLPLVKRLRDEMTSQGITTAAIYANLMHSYQRVGERKMLNEVLDEYEAFRRGDPEMSKDALFSCLATSGDGWNACLNAYMTMLRLDYTSPKILKEVMRAWIEVRSTQEILDSQIVDWNETSYNALLMAYSERGDVLGIKHVLSAFEGKFPNQPLIEMMRKLARVHPMRAVDLMSYFTTTRSVFVTPGLLRSALVPSSKDKRSVDAARTLIAIAQLYGCDTWSHYRQGVHVAISCSDSRAVEEFLATAAWRWTVPVEETYGDAFRAMKLWGNLEGAKYVKKEHAFLKKGRRFPLDPLSEDLNRQPLVLGYVCEVFAEAASVYVPVVEEHLEIPWGGLHNGLRQHVFPGQMVGVHFSTTEKAAITEKEDLWAVDGVAAKTRKLSLVHEKQTSYYASHAFSEGGTDMVMIGSMREVFQLLCYRRSDVQLQKKGPVMFSILSACSYFGVSLPDLEDIATTQEAHDEFHRREICGKYDAARWWSTKRAIIPLDRDDPDYVERNKSGMSYMR